MLGELNLSSWSRLALHSFEVGVRIGLLSLPPNFDGVLPRTYLDNRPFLRCLFGLSRAQLRCEMRENAVTSLRALLRFEPNDHLGASAAQFAKAGFAYLLLVERCVMSQPLTADDLLPLVARLAPRERQRLIHLIAATAERDASIYRASPPRPTEFLDDDESLQWDSDGWESFI